MKRYITILTVAIFVLSIFIKPVGLEACSAPVDSIKDPQQNYDHSTVVFIGEVVSAEEVGGEFGNIEITFSILKEYKGDVAGTVIIKTANSSAACGYDGVELFPAGSIWAMYPNDSFSTDIFDQNKKYESFEEAEAELNGFAKEKEVALCTLEYNPICGRIDTGIRCITTPCPSYDYETYSNQCFLDSKDAEFVHDGECGDEELDDGVVDSDNENISGDGVDMSDDMDDEDKSDNSDNETEDDLETKLETENLNFFQKIFFVIGNFFKTLFS